MSQRFPQHLNAQAMRKGSGMSAGRLVTSPFQRVPLYARASLRVSKRVSRVSDPITRYQLYFNKIQNSYNSLISLLSSFTRATGAAQGVIELLDARPSIADDLGERFSHPASSRGVHLALEDVVFAYESRPERTVLKGLSLDASARRRFTT